MVFSSHVFIYYFLPLTLLLYYAVPRVARMPVLTLASYVFYGWTNPWFILLLLWATCVDFVSGNLIYGHWKIMAPQRQRKVFLVVSLVSNLGLLCVFKYLMFLEENLNRLLETFGRDALPVITIMLPAGISFYTFESISYIVDIYFGRARPAIAWIEEAAGKPARSVWHRIGRELRAFNAFACYITQFPHLVAGPIIRYQDLEQQLHQRTHTIDKMGRGVFFFALGLAKKVLLANPSGEIADAAFSAHTLQWFDAWFGVFAYSFQIYFDFSGYSDMAIGLGLLFGFEFAKNFDSPYKAQSVTDFWRRWHISLSTWLRDYLYVPLGGNRLGETRTYINLLIVMLLGGLWHGASWNFLVWGGIHGTWLALERRMGKTSFYARAPAILRITITFVIVNLAWVFFRAEDLAGALRYTATLFGFRGDDPGSALLVRSVLYATDHVLAMLVAAGVAFFGMQTWDLARSVTPARAACAAGAFLWAVVALATQTFNPFLYFRF